MRHRIGMASSTGLGNPNPEILSNSGKLTPIIKEMMDEAIDLYFKKWGGCDYKVKNDFIEFGIEPAYMHEDLKIIHIDRDKKLSFIKTGRAWDSYGSGIASKTMFYEDYVYNGKFKKFIDKWHAKLF